MAAGEVFGGIEAGGTKFVCAVGSDPDHIVDEVRFPTTTPEETLGRAIAFFEPFVRSGQVKSMGVACFGPLDLDPDSQVFGSISSTPKPGWSHTNVIQFLQDRLNTGVVIDTDVNGAALGEFTWGAAKGLDPALYLTVGTGIGGGLIKDGKPYHGLLAPEMGHLRIPHDLTLDPFAGMCPFHGDCLEGLACGSAIEKRLGKRGEELREDDPFWDVEAGYLAYALANYIVTLSPRIILMGGGVMEKPMLLPAIRAKVQQLLNGYVQSEKITGHIEEYILPPGLGKKAGVLGAIALARLGKP